MGFETFDGVVIFTGGELRISRDLFAAMSGGQALMLCLSVLATAAVMVVLALFPDRLTQLIIVGLVIVILVLGARAALPPEAHRMRAIRYAVTIFGGILFLIAGSHSYIETFITPFLAEVLPEFALPENLPILSTGLVLVATVLMFALVLWVLRDTAPLGTLAQDPLIRTASYRDRRKAFVDVLKSHLERVDEDLRWHHRDFVSLRAEVDVRNTKRRVRRRVADLVEAIKLNRDADIFVVVGVPGAGKSVALRKCCMDLLGDQRPNERIPIYVNLKEWTSQRAWTAESPPTDAEFAAFVRANVRDRLPDRARSFFNEHFDRLVDAGEIFFLFDSFDEMPGVLDADETSKLLDAVSAVIVHYLRAQADGRGVVASRYFRRPRLGQARHIQLDVRPFSERQIAQVVAQSASRSDALNRLLFKERPELGTLARNPFTLSLILLYWESHLAPPQSQAELFSAYIDRSLDDAGESLTTMGLKPETMRHAMADISWAMFESDRRGLEMTVQELRDTLQRNDVDVVVDALVAARLARKAARTQAVSFVHRRFNEYFLVARWLSGERMPPFEAIPLDGRFRDALALYAEVANEDEVARLAAFCWSEIQAAPENPTDDSRLALRAIYSLRFLTEAFRARVDPLKPFRVALGKRVRSITTNSNDILTRKLAVEAVGLAYPADAESILLMALSTGNRWITDTAFAACRYLPTLPRRVEDALYNSITAREQFWILNPDREFGFILGIADAFANLRRRFVVFRIEMWISTIIGIAVFILICSSNPNIALKFFFTIIFISLSIFFSSTLLSNSTPSFKSIILRFEPSGITFFSENVSYSEFFIGCIRAFPLLILFFYFADKLPLIYTDAEKLYFFVYIMSYKEFFLPVFVLYIPFFSLYFEYLHDRDWSIGKIYDYSDNRMLGWSYFKLSCISAFNTLCNIWVGLFIFFTIFSLFVVMIIVIQTYFQVFFVIIMAIIAAAICIIVLFYLIKGAIGKFRFWRSDRTRLAASMTRFNPSRILIAETFEEFETETARLRYVRWVEHEAAAPTYVASLADLETNPWPGGRRPNANDDEASILLAQLDARWLGIDA